MKIDRALQIVSRARIRRYAFPTRTEAPSPSSERDARGRFLQGHVGVSPGRPPRDELREMYIDDLFHSWRYGGRAAIRRLIKQDPATYLRIMINVVGKLHSPSDRDGRDTEPADQCRAHR